MDHIEFSLLMFLSTAADQGFEYLGRQLADPVLRPLIGQHMKTLLNRGICKLIAKHSRGNVIINSKQFEFEGFTSSPASKVSSYYNGRFHVSVPQHYLESHDIALQHQELPCVVAKGGFIEGTNPRRLSQSLFPLELLSVQFEPDQQPDFLTKHAHKWGPRGFEPITSPGPEADRTSSSASASYLPVDEWMMSPEPVRLPTPPPPGTETKSKAEEPIDKTTQTDTDFDRLLELIPTPCRCPGAQLISKLMQALSVEKTKPTITAAPTPFADVQNTDAHGSQSSHLEWGATLVVDQTPVLEWRRHNQPGPRPWRQWFGRQRNTTHKGQLPQRPWNPIDGDEFYRRNNYRW